MNEIDFTKLSPQELFELEDKLGKYIRGITLPEPDFYLHKSIQVEERSYVNPETLIPMLEFRISVNKEDMMKYRMLWEEYYQKEIEYNRRYRQNMKPADQVTLEIRRTIEEVFSTYLDRNHGVNIYE